MALTDDELLDFDSSNYDTYDEGKARETLAGEHAEIFRSHLVAARWADGLREATVEHDEKERAIGGDDYTFSADYTAGWEKALREVSAYLRQGDLIPGGVLYSDTVGWPK